MLWIKRKRGTSRRRARRLPADGTRVAPGPVRVSRGGPAWQRLPTVPLPLVGQPAPVPNAAPDLVRGHVRGHLHADVPGVRYGDVHGGLRAGESGGRHRAAL
jgi:hypothetical protein